MSSTNGVFTQSYAAGSVTLTNNYSGNETAEVIHAGGIAAMTQNNVNFIITKCAALGALVINGSNTAAGKTWRRIAYLVSTGTNTQFVNNITNTPLPGGYSAGLDAADKQDGLTVAEITEDTFFGTGEVQLGWNRAVWDWNAASGWPVLKYYFQETLILPAGPGRGALRSLDRTLRIYAA